METAGLVLSFIGSLVLAFSVSKNAGDAHQVVNGRIDYLAVIHLKRFRYGIVMLALGFLLQSAPFVYTLVVNLVLTQY